MVLLHATGTSATGWLLNVGPLSQEHRVFAVDILGEAGRSRQTALLRDRRDCVDWVSAVLDGLGLERASLVGWSFGGWATMAFVIAHPQRVNRCVLLAPFGSLAPYAPAVLTFLKVGPYLPMGPPGRLALRMMSPGHHFEEHFARQFALGGRYFRAADPRASAFPQPYGDARAAVHLRAGPAPGRGPRVDVRPASGCRAGPGADPPRGDGCASRHRSHARHGGRRRRQCPDACLS